MKEVLLAYLKNYTNIPETQLMEVIDQLEIKSFKKNTILIRQGDTPHKCYFILKGIIRKYTIDSEGNECTSYFYTENQTAAVFNPEDINAVSKYTLSCLEDSSLLVGDISNENRMFHKYPFLESIIKKMLNEYMASFFDEYANFIASSPEERYLSLISKRPGLSDRVPQYQLASYLGIKPESLSRIKRRLSSPNK